MTAHSTGPALATPPRCAEHSTDLEWLDGSPLPGHNPDFRPHGWICPCDPGHPSPQPARATRRTL